MDNQENKARLKSLNNIEEETKQLVDNISNEKSKTEEGIKNLIFNVETSFETAKTETEKHVLELNKKRINLEKAVKSKLSFASNTLSKSVETSKQNYDNIGREYRNSQMILLAILIFIVFFYDFTVSHIPWIEYTYQGNNVVKTLLVISAVYFMRRSFIRLNDLLHINTTHLDNKIGEINLLNSSSKEITIPQQKFYDTKLHFNYAKEFLESLIVNVGKTIPAIKQIFEQLNLLIKYQGKVDDFKSALSYFNLLEDDGFFTDLKSIVPAGVHITDDERVLENSIIEKIINRLNNQNVQVSKDIILLLYREHNGFDTTSVYREIISADLELSNLVKLLIDSNRLIEPPNDIVYRSQDIVAIFKNVENFDIQEINKQLSNSLRILDYLNSYIEFLEKNGVYSGDKLNLEFIINEIDNEHLSFEEQVVELTYILGIKNFRKMSSLNNNYIEGFARASVSIKFHDEISMRKYACKCSAQDHAVAVIRAYYEKANEIDRTEAVYIKDLLNDLKLVNNKLDNKENDPTFRFLKIQLNEGKWYDSSAAYFKDFLEVKTEEIKDQISNIEKFTILKNAVKMTFQKVQISTVEKAIDAQVFGAYIIMSSSEKGHLLTEVADKLSKRDLGNTKKENRWNYKSIEQIESIENIFGVIPKYDFMRFSYNTRIGVIDKGESFLDFQMNFFSDVKVILSNKNEYFDSGLVIQRINPSKYSFGILDDNELSDNIDLKNLDVARYIARLASDHIPYEEQTSIMKFEKNIDLLEIVDLKSIYELIEVEEDEIVGIERKILKSPELKKLILKRLDEEIGINNFKILALDLRHQNISKNEVSQIINDVLIDSFSSQQGLKRKAEIRAKLLSKRFVNALDKLALIYELQKEK